METHCFDVLAVFDVSCIILRWLQLSLAESIPSEAATFLQTTIGISWMLLQHALPVFVDAIGTVEPWFLGETLEKFHNVYKALGETTVTILYQLDEHQHSQSRLCREELAFVLNLASFSEMVQVG